MIFDNFNTDFLLDGLISKNISSWHYLKVEDLALEEAFWLGIILHIENGDFLSPATNTKRSSTPYPLLGP